MKIQAACSLCPAYDISQAFTGLATQFPAVDSHILASMKKCFIKHNQASGREQLIVHLNCCTQAVLSGHNLPALLECSEATTIQQFIMAHFPFAGHATLEQYFAANNPMKWVHSVQRPVLIVNRWRVQCGAI